jgi:hypothetical protein|tara:strand:- start:922 stop:1173 length:252 start_codon:yes stop_codon:yes gene_type:complete
MLYVLEVKTENVEDYLALRQMIRDFLDWDGTVWERHADDWSDPDPIATKGSGDPYYFRPRQIDSTRPLKNTATPPNRNIEEEN